MDDKELLSCSLTSHSMNRLAIQQLLAKLGTTNPPGNCKILLSFKAPKDGIDGLTALLHSIHIQKIKRLDIQFVLYPSAYSLVTPLRRILCLLHHLSYVEEMTFLLPPQLARDGASMSDRALKETVLAFEDVLNETILKSCKRLYLQGFCNLLDQVYQFRGDDSTPTTLTQGGGRKILQRLVGARDYLDRIKEKKTDDTIVQDDRRYSRTTIAGTRIFAHCSSPALSRTRLTHINMSTLDFLRPPFSQWLLTMLRASPITSMSFHFSNLPKATPDSPAQAERDFMLARLAAVLPTLQSIHTSGLRDHAIPTFVKFMNGLPRLSSIIILSTRDVKTLAAFASTPAPLNNVNSDINSTPHTFSPTLRTIDAPLHYLTWLFRTACPRTSNPSRPDLPLKVTDSLPRFPSLRRVHIDYYCVREVPFEIHNLAEGIRSIQEAIKSTSGSELTPPRKNKVIIDVHLKFDKDFRGLLPSWSKGDTGVSQLSLTKAALKTALPDIEGSDALARWFAGVPAAAPDIAAGPSPASNNEEAIAADDVDALAKHGGEEDGELSPDAVNFALLAAVQRVSITLPGPRRDILSDGRFTAEMLSLVTVFWGLKYLKVFPIDATGGRRQHVTPPVSLPSTAFEGFQARNPRLKRIMVY